MLHTLAQAAVTVTETVTNTPSPTVPVEIVKQPSSGWETKDTVTAALSILAVIVSVYTWKGQGARPKFETSVWGHSPESSMIRINLVNYGRLTAIPSSIEVVGPSDKFLPVRKGDFVPLHKEDEIEQEPLPPGGMFTADMPLIELPHLVPKKLKNTTTLRSFYFQTAVSGKHKEFKVSRRDARAWQGVFKTLIEGYWKDQEKIDEDELLDCVGEELLEGVPPLPSRFKERRLEKIKTWFRTLL